MSLNDFLADESTGKTSWADDMDDLPLARELKARIVGTGKETATNATAFLTLPFHSRTT